ncbi:hypothetical protein BS50DRAFT_583925 [Corynespora cassiicola Philippines]|uniref:Uncharacterized protein n=1 Tax=Corynespora cassiicola Philippines TaxID=1448308 RepID=A0A2T2P3Z9_CORCC|nr:hypothetical protein BS50DRAFT_583925 [Corynespora cassiicola Philippines]
MCSRRRESSNSPLSCPISLGECNDDHPVEPDAEQESEHNAEHDDYPSFSTKSTQSICQGSELSILRSDHGLLAPSCRDLGSSTAARKLDGWMQIRIPVGLSRKYFKKNARESLTDEGDGNGGANQDAEQQGESGIWLHDSASPAPFSDEVRRGEVQCGSEQEDRDENDEDDLFRKGYEEGSKGDAESDDEDDLFRRSYQQGSGS